MEMQQKKLIRNRVLVRISHGFYSTDMTRQKMRRKNWQLYPREAKNCHP